MAGQPAVGQAFRWYGEGEYARALEAARQRLEADPADVNALHVAGLATARLGDAVAALEILGRALSLEPASVALWISKGKILEESGRAGEAHDAFVRATGLDPASYHAQLERGLVEAKLARVREAAHSLLRAWRLRRDDVAAQRELFGLLRRHPDRFPDAPVPPPPAARPFVSVVICSVDEAKFAAASRSFARAFGDWQHELVGIHDARSLAEAYNRALRACRGEIVVFSHDDVEVLSPDLGGALARAFGQADVVGIVGTERLTGPAWAWAGREPARGRIVQPAAPGEGLELLVLGAPDGVAAGLQALDGVFLAVRREQALALGFDEQAFDGFHLYDIDFTYRAFRQGLRVAVTPEILLRHDSLGGFDERWSSYASRFRARFPALSGPSKADFVPLGLEFAGGREAAAFCARLDALCREAPP
jgi:hypothetical protein